MSGFLQMENGDKRPAFELGLHEFFQQPQVKTQLETDKVLRRCVLINFVAEKLRSQAANHVTGKTMAVFSSMYFHDK